METLPEKVTSNEIAENNEIKLSPDINTWMPELIKLHERSNSMTPAEQIKFLKETSIGQMEMTIDILNDLCSFFMSVQDMADDMGINLEDIKKAASSKKEKMKFFMKMGKAVMNLAGYEMPEEMKRASDTMINKYAPFYKFLNEQKELANANEYRKK